MQEYESFFVRVSRQKEQEYYGKDQWYNRKKGNVVKYSMSTWKICHTS